MAFPFFRQNDQPNKFKRCGEAKKELLFVHSSCPADIHAMNGNTNTEFSTYVHSIHKHIIRYIQYQYRIQIQLNSRGVKAPLVTAHPISGDRDNPHIDRCVLGSRIALNKVELLETSSGSHFRQRTDHYRVVVLSLEQT